MKIILDRASVHGTTPISKVESHISVRCTHYTGYMLASVKTPPPLRKKKREGREGSACLACVNSPLFLAFVSHAERSVVRSDNQKYGCVHMQ